MHARTYNRSDIACILIAIARNPCTKIAADGLAGVNNISPLFSEMIEKGKKTKMNGPAKTIADCSRPPVDWDEIFRHDADNFFSIE